MNPDLERLLKGLAPPPPEGPLRERTLAKAALALEAPAPRDRWREAWESRPLRLAWATAVLLLVATHVFLVPKRPAPDANVVRGTDLPGTPGEDAAALLVLPRLRPGYADAGSTSVATAPVQPSGTVHPPLAAEGPEKGKSS